MKDSAPLAFALGRPVGDLPLAAEVEELPPHAAIVVANGADLAAAQGRRLRDHCGPEACLIARIEPRDAACADELVALGYDAVAVGAGHLERVLKEKRELLELRATLEPQRALYDGLVTLIDEIARSPGLQQVLNIAILRLSELFSVDRVSVIIFDQHSEVGFVVMERERALLDNVVISIADYPELKEIIRTKSPLIISDVFGDALLEGVRNKLTRAHEPHQAAVLFPLARKEQVVGALFLRSRERMREVDETLLTMGRLIAALTSVAIGHALEQDTLLSEKRALQRSKASVDEQLEGLKQLRDFLDQAKDGMVICDPAGVIRYANAAAATILQQPFEGLPGRRFTDVLLPHCHGLAERALRGDDVGDEYGYVDLTAAGTNAGETGGIVISASIRTLISPEGVFISFRDVTGLREIESELRQTKEFLENLIQSSVDAIISTDTEGRVILFNRAAEQLLGYDASEVVGHANISMFYPTGEASYDVMRKLRSEAYGGRGRLQLLGTELVAKGGRPVPVNLTAAMIYEGSREVATVTILSDLRERRRIEEKLSQVQRRLHMTERQTVAIELAGVAAHELNQPLTSILGYAEMLRRRIPEGDQSRKAVDVICRETERMAGIVRRLGQITRYQTKQYVGSSQILDLGEGGESPGGVRDDEDDVGGEPSASGGQKR
jgi:PAS domain S-box-containing protein